ncbi:MAG: glycoside hydrolase family 16 protein [Fibrobacter sp.]|nr:glycoside hydrolase family 16 protein [Fibrobacter sp.]
MFKKIGIPFFTVAAACAIFTSCSSDSNSAGPAGVPQDSSFVTPESSDSVTGSIESSSSVVANSSSSVAPDDVPSVPSTSSSSVVPSDSSSTVVSSSSGVVPESVPGAIPGGSDATSTSSATVAESPSSSATAPDNTPSDTPADPAAFWSDEFQGDALDITKWSYEIGTGEWGWGNNEQQYYTDRTENAYVKDGYLHIRAALETDAAAIESKFGGKKYTSARIVTKGKFDFAYGTIEARIALPVGKGIWPAFWMLGANIDDASWPLCGEVDIIEAVNDESVVYGTHHWDHKGQHAEFGNSTREYYGTSYPMDITEFHIYKTVWNEKSIAMYVDDFKYQEIGIEDASGEMGTFHKNFFFILNVAVGGQWPGFDIDDDQFPNEMIVDYIRVYKN